jgi:small subunit ribosomal protein S6
MAKLSAKYEVIYVIDPAVGEEGIAALVEKFNGIVGNYGTVSSVDEWGKRRLAYPINDLVEGYYVYMTCEVSPDMPAELDRVFKITDGILRSIIVAVEE